MKNSEKFDLPNKRKRKGAYLFLGFSFVLLAVFILISPSFKYWVTLNRQQEILERPKEQAVTTVEGDNWVEEEIVDYDPNYVYNVDTSELRFVGEIAIPEARGMLLPILEGLTNLNATSGAATMKPGQIQGEGNYALGSHRLINPYLLFTPLEIAKPGMTIWTNDSESIYEYKIYSTDVVDYRQGDVIDDDVAFERGVPVITLVTCTWESNGDRHVVQGELVDSWKIEDAPERAKTPFNKNFSVLDNAAKWATHWASTLGEGFRRE